VRDHTSENAAEAGTGTAKEAGAVLYPKMSKSPHVATEVAAETDSVPNAIPALTEADLLTLLHGKLQEAIQKTGLQVNQTEMLSEAASTPDLTVGTWEFLDTAGRETGRTEIDTDETMTEAAEMVEQAVKIGKMTAERLTQNSQPACLDHHLHTTIRQLFPSERLSHYLLKSFWEKSRKSKQHLLRYV